MSRPATLAGAQDIEGTAAAHDGVPPVLAQPAQAGRRAWLKNGTRPGTGDSRQRRDQAPDYLSERNPNGILDPLVCHTARQVLLLVVDPASGPGIPLSVRPA